MASNDDVAVLWEQNAEAWTQLARMGYDIYRDGCNTPAFLKTLPRVRKLRGLDVGCGEGENTRRIAQLGATMTGTDVSTTFVKHCRDFESDDKAIQSITYLVASANKLPFFDQSFDFVVSTMVLMDLDDLDGSLKEIHRVLKRDGGFFQFSIVHPCFQTPGMRWVLDEHGNRISMEASRYFEEGRIDDEWMFTAPEQISSSFKPFKVAHFHRTLSSWMKLLIETGFSLELLNEPTPDDASIQKYPPLACMRSIPLFLHMRWRRLT